LTAKSLTISLRGLRRCECLDFTPASPNRLTLPVRALERHAEIPEATDAQLG
jgi:hypothetical protein